MYYSSQPYIIDFEIPKKIQNFKNGLKKYEFHNKKSKMKKFWNL